jgi:hypothetical protein
MMMATRRITMYVGSCAFTLLLLLHIHSPYCSCCTSTIISGASHD